MVMMNCFRKVGFLVAEKSFHKPIVGFISKSVGCIPVIRPQDAVKTGSGTITGATDNPHKIIGTNTCFCTEIQPGYQIRVKGTSVATSGAPVKVLEVLDNETLMLESPLCDDRGRHVVISATSDDDDDVGLAFGIFEKVNQKSMFSEVHAHLRKGRCLGIFPEGGSHDRTDLLPLKAGVSLIAFGARDKYDIDVPVVPVGLNYYRGHRFRGRVVIEFGTPVRISSEAMEVYRQDKRVACNAFLDRVQEGMRSVIVTAPNYATLQLIVAARRLFQPSGIRLSPRATQDLNRRFSEGYRHLMHLALKKDEHEQVSENLNIFEYL